MVDVEKDCICHETVIGKLDCPVHPRINPRDVPIELAYFRLTKRLRRLAVETPDAHRFNSTTDAAAAAYRRAERVTREVLSRLFIELQEGTIVHPEPLVAKGDWQTKELRR